MEKQRTLAAGDKIERLTIIEDLGLRSVGNKKRRFFLCECECKKRI